MKSKMSGMLQAVFLNSSYSLTLVILTLFLIISFLVHNNTAEAQQLVCPQRAIEQITDETTNGNSNQASINADGTRIAFRSSANINGGNPDNDNQIYLFTAMSGISQITDILGADSNEPSINADGTRIAFSSEANIGGGNMDGNFEIYLFDTTTGMFTQITDTMGGESIEPSINADGTRIAFSSDADILGPNLGGNPEIYLFDSTTGIFTQITDEPFGESTGPSINANGTRIAFASTANIGGVNPGGNQAIFLFDTTTGIFTRITVTDGSSFEASINADGTRIAFVSRANINGGNPNGVSQIFLFNTVTGIFTQITSDPSENSGDPSINADGTRIAFQSRANINGGNPDGNRDIYISDTLTGIITQITDTVDAFSFDPSINADGTRIAFDSDANINGGNPDERDEIWLATCLDPMTFRNIPTLSEWGLIGMAAVLGLIGLSALRRRKAFG